MSSCILMAQLLGGPAQISATSSADARHALERARNRMKLALEARGGRLQDTGQDGICADFDSVDAAALAACEMIERVCQLPPSAGTRFGVRAAIHVADDLRSAVSEAGRLATLTRPAETLLSPAAAALLKPSTRQFARATPLEDATRGQELVALLRHAGLADTAESPVSHSPRLRLHHQGRTLFVDASRPSLMLGREQDNDLVLDDRRASRRHARIDFRDDRFSLTDHSSNGSWLAMSGGNVIHIKGEEAELPQQGRIGLGTPTDEGEINLIDFDIH